MTRLATLVAAVLLAATAASAEPCDDVNRGLTMDQGTRAAAVIAAQLGVPEVRLVQALHYQGWSVMHVQPAGMEPAFLFYRGDPGRSRYITLWAGAALRSEERSIAAWAVQNAPGIPAPLAACFARVAVGR